MYQDPYSTNPTLRAVKAKDATPSYDTLIVHHLSDPHYGRIGNEVHPLEQYKAAISRLPEEKQPHLIIITGDLTLTGTREELREAAIHIRGAMQANKHQQRVFIVPGPHDIDWSNPASVDSFESLRSSLQGVVLPSFLDRNGAIMAGPEPYAHSMADNYLVYLVNTCMTPEAPPRPTPKHIEDLHKQYRAIWKEFLQKSGGITTDRERQEFLKQTQPFIDRDLGYIARAEIDRFGGTLQALHLEDPHMALSQPGEELPVPLKILVSHHPLIAYIGRNAHPYYAAANSGPLVDTARHYGFHLALHGHTHEPHALSDLVLSHYTTSDNALLQIGAGSLGAMQGSPTYNDLTAQRDHATGAWSLDLRVINLGNESDALPIHFVLSNPTKPATAVAVIGANRARDADFNYRMQVAMEQFSEDLEGQSRDLPLRPLKIIEGAIKEVVFKGYEVRVSLPLKQRFSTTGDVASRYGNIVLENHYIDPGAQTDPLYMHPFSYPDTLAAWSLIQGEILCYPENLKDGGKTVDYSWLDLSGKYPKVLNQLKLIAEQRGPNSMRAYDLHAKLSSRQLKLSDIFKPAPDTPATGFSPHFTSFISVPVPLRPTENRRSPLPEIGVLNIDVVDVSPHAPGSAFTPDRVEMLRTISGLITTILLTSHKLGRPWGAFENV